NSKAISYYSFDFFLSFQEKFIAKCFFECFLVFFSGSLFYLSPARSGERSHLFNSGCFNSSNCRVSHCFLFRLCNSLISCISSFLALFAFLPETTASYLYSSLLRPPRNLLQCNSSHYCRGFGYVLWKRAR